VGAFDSLVPNRRALELRLAEEEKPNGEKCIFFQLEPRNKYNDLPCGFDWDSEPKKLGRTGKPLKTQKPPPKKCSKACRNWTPRDLPSDEEVEPYTDAEIRTIEIETLGIYLSSSPFDVIPTDYQEMLTTANQLQSEPSGYYLSAIMVSRVKDHQTKDGKLMKFVTAETASGTMDITVFSDKLAAYGKYLQPGQMALAEVHKNDRGITLRQMEAL
jgi:DNA polymerase III subunit alpha